MNCQIFSEPRKTEKTFRVFRAFRDFF